MWIYYKVRLYSCVCVACFINLDQSVYVQVKVNKPDVRLEKVIFIRQILANVRDMINKHVLR